MLFLIACHFFFFSHTSTTEIYTLSLHDALPIFLPHEGPRDLPWTGVRFGILNRDFVMDRVRIDHGQAFDHMRGVRIEVDRKSTRLNSSLVEISYAVFCLKKKKTTYKTSIKRN